MAKVTAAAAKDSDMHLAGTAGVIHRDDTRLASPTLAGLLDVACKPGATKATPAAQESTATDRRLRLQIKSGFQRQINEHLVLDHLVSGCKVFLASCTNLPNDSQLLVS